MNKTYIFSDLHGAGKEFEKLLDKISPTSDDQIIIGGDMFDRGLHADIIWQLIQKHNILCLMGNHEYKMIQWMRGERDWLPGHYYIALNILTELVSPSDLLDWLQKRPLSYQGKDFLVVHAGIDVNSPLTENVSLNVYGNLPNVRAKKGEKEYQFWDHYDGDLLVIYGHLVCDKNKPRIALNNKGKINSIGIDTAVVHGGVITAFCPEDSKFFTYESKKDWGQVVKDQIKAESKIKFPNLNHNLLEFVNQQKRLNRNNKK